MDHFKGFCKKSSFAVWTTLTLSACQMEVQESVLVYENDFDDGILSAINGGDLFIYEGNQMVGNYNKQGFLLNLQNLPDHDFISIAFDLYIHDSWDGNNNSPDGPDIWGMQVDDIIFETTFSNTICGSLYCLKQSYPAYFPTWNIPRTDAYQVNMPTVCHNRVPTSSTSLYKIRRSFRHRKASATISFYDRLVQANVEDPKCDESWSLDNLTIEAVTIK